MLQQKLNRKDNPQQIWNWEFREFGGMNTQAYRTAIKDDEFAWLENIQPIGHGNLRVVPKQSGALQTVVTGNAYYGLAYNQGGVDVMFVACDDGSAYQILCKSPFTRTLIGAAGTFSNAGVQAAQWENLGIVIIDPAKGYFDWNITAPATLTLIDNTVLGYLIAVFSGRVWVALNGGRTIQFSDASVFSPITGGSAGSIIFVDPTLHDSINDLTSANNFLYIWGDDSANTISDVRVVGGTALFSNVNIQAMAGTSFPGSVYPYFRAIMFASPYGFYQLYGATPTKISDPLDGLFPHIDLTKPITGGSVVINNIVCAAFCFTYNDPLLATTRQLLAVFFANKWFVSSQGNIKFIFGTSIDGKQTLFGSDGASIFQLLSDTASNIDWEVQTKLYPYQSAIYQKSALKFGVELNLPSNSVGMNVSIDAANNPSVDYSLTAATTLTFIGLGPISFIGTGPIVFVRSGFGFFASAVSNWGTYLGSTITSSSPGAQLTMIAMQYELTGADWTT